MTDISFDVFEQVFRDNINTRSRTAKGKSDTASSSTKKKLLLEGEDLKKQVELNTKLLIKGTWTHGNNYKNTLINALHLRIIMEGWFDINTQGLQRLDVYKEELAALGKTATELSLRYGRNYKINRRYRVWPVSYTTLNIQPIDLEFFMDEFYVTLSNKIQKVREGNLSQAELLAFADLMIDGEIHPWSDGCGRISTAVVMWLSVVSGCSKLPIFGTREKHYASIREVEGCVAHARYFEACLRRFEQ
ncbi:MAG: hypothetical protein HYT93_04955 [Parcubacteria group bacterium]|nr:hypothetical protein [Parcubacteria group bacterium]